MNDMALKKQRVSLRVEITDNGTRALDERLANALLRHREVSAVHLDTHPSDNEPWVIAKVGVDYTPKPHETVEHIKRWWRFRVIRWLEMDAIMTLNIAEEADIREASA